MQLTGMALSAHPHAGGGANAARPVPSILRICHDNTAMRCENCVTPQSNTQTCACDFDVTLSREQRREAVCARVCSAPAEARCG